MGMAFHSQETFKIHFIIVFLKLQKLDGNGYSTTTDLPTFDIKKLISNSWYTERFSKFASLFIINMI